MSTTTPTTSAEATPPLTATAGIEPPCSEPFVRACCGRRTVLRAAGLVAMTGGAVALTACSGDSGAAGPTAGATSAEPSASESPSAVAESASASESPSGTQSSEAAPKGTTVAVSEVAVGGGLVVEQKYVVTQPTAGEFKAFSAICTHQGCVVGSVEEGAIVCPCHMSHFDISTGDPVSGPAQQPLPTVPFTASGDTIVLTV